MAYMVLYYIAWATSNTPPVIQIGCITGITDDYRQIQVAVFFNSCEATQLTNVHITSSNSAGAVVYNPVSVVNITSCLFSHNDVSGEQEATYGEGSLLVIEVNEVTSQSFCTITNSTFTHSNGDFYQDEGSISVVFS